jgi:uncharacterized LabA/DUF88 family protein
MATYLFIDGNYLRTHFNKQMKAFYDYVPEIEFEQIRKRYNAQRVYYYDAIDYTQAQNEANEAYAARIDAREDLHDYINSLPHFHVREGVVRKSPKKKNREQKGVDVQLAVDAMEHAARGNMTLAVFLTGDLDFEPLLSALLRAGVGTLLAYIPSATSKELMRAADQIQKVTLEHFHTWSAPSFRENYRAIKLHHGERPPEQPIFASVRRGKWGKRKVTLFRAQNQAPHRLFVERGNELRERSYMFEYHDINKLELAFELTFGKIEWE